MFPRTVEDIPQLLTERVLESYAAYIRQNTQPSSDGSACAGVSAQPGYSTLPPAPRGGCAVNCHTPESLQEALAPLEIVFGKTALSAMGIALHGTEAIVRCMERGDPGVSQPESLCSDPPVDSIGDDGIARAGLSPRCLYRVGDHTLLSPYYCPCSAYAFQSVRREEVYFCKHLLALQLALWLEATGIRQDNILIREVDPVTFEALLFNEIG